MLFRPVTSSQMLATTAVVSGMLLFTGIIFLVLDHQLRGRGLGPIHYVFRVSAIFMLILLAGSLSFRIRSYEVASGNLLVKIGFSTKVFPLQNLEDARVEERPFSGSIRTFGVGGMWSNSGSFRSSRWGDFLAYASDSSSGVLLVWPDKKVLVTPADASGFVEAVKQKK